MATFTSIRVSYRSTGHTGDIHSIKPRWGHIVWITLPTGERHRVLLSTGTNGQERNISHAISGHHIASITGADRLERPDWRRYPAATAQACIDRICQRNGATLVADTIRQCAIVGPFLNPEWIR